MNLLLRISDQLVRSGLLSDWSGTMTIKYKYLRVWFDYRSTGIFTEGGSPVKKDALELPRKIWESIDVLLDKYGAITLDYGVFTGTVQKRLLALDTVRQLDIAGINVAREIKDIVGDDVIVEYFSEGLIRVVPFTWDTSSLDEMLEEERMKII